MNRVTLHITGKESRQEAVRRFSGSTGIQGTLLPLHLYGIFFGGTASYHCRVFPALSPVRHIQEGGRSLPLLVGILSATACIWILDIRIRIPGDMLPSQWSDFAFWAEAAEQKAGEIALLFKAEKSGMELSYFTSAFISGLFSIFSVLPGYFFLRSLRLRKLSSLLMMTGFFLLLSFSFCILHGQNSSALIQERILWLFFPFCLWLTFAENEYRYPVPAALEETAIVLNLFFHYTEITSLFCAQKERKPNRKYIKIRDNYNEKKEPITNGLDRTSQ